MFKREGVIVRDQRPSGCLGAACPNSMREQAHLRLNFVYGEDEEQAVFKCWIPPWIFSTRRCAMRVSGLEESDIEQLAAQGDLVYQCTQQFAFVEEPEE